jgi:sugar phosphate permease
MSSAASPDPQLVAWRRRVFAATWLSYFGFYFCRKPFYVAKAEFEESFNWSPSVLGWIGVAYLVAYAFGQFTSGWAGNRYGPRVVLLAGMAISVACNFAFGLGPGVAAFIALMTLNGLVQASGWSNNVGTMANWFHRGERGTVMGVWATNFQVGGVAATALASWAASAWGWRAAFFTGSAVLSLVWVFFLLNQRDRPRDVGLPPVRDPADTTPHGTVVEDAPWSTALITNVFLIGCFYFFVKFIRYALWSWAPFLLKREYGLEIDEAGYLSTLFDLGGVAGVFLCGFLSDRAFGGRRVGVSLLFIVGMSLACALLLALGSTSLWWFGGCMALIGFTLYGPDALMSGAGAMDVGSPKQAVLAAGVINGMGSIGAVVQELVLGQALADSGSGTVFALLMGSSVGAMLCLGALFARGLAGRASV